MFYIKYTLHFIFEYILVIYKYIIQSSYIIKLKKIYFKTNRISYIKPIRYKKI